MADVREWRGGRDWGLVNFNNKTYGVSRSRKLFNNIELIY